MKEFATEIIIALISGFISSAITFWITKTYLGFKNFRGLKNMVRLNKDCFSSGIINVFQNRKVVIKLIFLYKSTRIFPFVFRNIKEFKENHCITM